jgi:hypothetical protein
MTQHYARAYDSEQAVEAHAALSPVGQLESTRDGAAIPATDGAPILRRIWDAADRLPSR